MTHRKVGFLFLELHKKRGESMVERVNVPVGASARKCVEVTPDMTVAHFHSGMPEVFGTPMMVCLMEEAAREAIQKYLPEGWVSVGTIMNIKHLAPSPVGVTVTATAEVVTVSGNQITFVMEAHDGFERVGEGMQVRTALDLKRFEKRAGLKQKAPDDSLRPNIHDREHVERQSH